jgi:cytochrome bd-type quinol oxidase subunit 2
VIRRPTPWISVLVLATLITAVDGFAMTSLRGAVGYIGRTQEPFASFLLLSALQLPVVVVAVWAAFLVARHRTGRHRNLVVGGLTAAITTVVAVGLATATTVSDHRLQAAEMSTMHASLENGVATQIRALVLLALVLLTANLLITAWVAAARGGRLLG